MILNIAIGLALLVICWLVFRAGLQSLRWIREIVEDNKTGKLSSTKVAFMVAFVLASFVFLKLSFALLALLANCGGAAAEIAITTSLLSFLRDFFTIYIGAFAATSLGSKAINTIGSRLSFKPGTEPTKPEEEKEEFPSEDPPKKTKNKV
jgi:hypothetical protein